jgi:hypothetical protein
MTDAAHRLTDVAEVIMQAEGSQQKAKCISYSSNTNNNNDDDDERATK